MALTLVFALTVVISSLGVLEARQLPSYIKPCSKSDPELNKCIKERAIEVLPRILQGDKSYKIPSFSPFRIPLIDVKGSSGLSFQLKDLELDGLNTTEIRTINFDIPNKKISVEVFIKDTKMNGRYSVDGKIFSLSLKGEGPANFNSENVTVHYTIDYELIFKNNKNFIDINNFKTNLDLDIAKTHYYFGNLFGGNKLLGDNLNQLLNDNPKEVDELSGDANKVIINSIVSSLFTALFKIVSFDEIFVD
ncbi:unnamed protein product [Phyllotreta striolata]|uniref:Uncharacterized protein n=1 Tax=Phyllotreta striolata TaxID=444603 RepID=A0A9N9TZX0_PHYSR|nr:unnamed protein product [Phyllotreta striolata]